MTTNRTHTHNGNCQVCGRPQAVDVGNGTLALHGYTVEGGYFSGTCSGSRELPLQVSRVITDATIKSLGEHAAQLAKLIKRCEAGKAHPALVDQYDDGPGYPRVIQNAKFEAVQIKWEAANAYSREHGLKVYIANRDSERRWAISHAASLKALADRLHGTDLIPVEVEQRAKSERKGTRAAASARKEKLYQLSRAFERGYDEINKIYLALPREGDSYSKRISTPEQDNTYGGVTYPHQWNAKRRAAVLAAWTSNPKVAEIVAKLDAIVAEHKATKEAA